MIKNAMERPTMTALPEAQDAANTPNRAYIEAYGVKGMKSRPWRRTFKNAEALHAWCEKNSAEVHGTRDAE